MILRTAKAATLAVVALGASIAGYVISSTAASFAQESVSNPPPPGTVVNASNASAYGQFLPPAADLGIKYGMTMRVVPSKRIDWSEGFTSATEKYSGQVALDKDDYITKYIA